MKSETYYLVFIEWPEGRGGQHRFEKRAEAIEAAEKMQEKWSSNKCKVVCLKITKTEMDFSKASA